MPPDVAQIITVAADRHDDRDPAADRSPVLRWDVVVSCRRVLSVACAAAVFAAVIPDDLYWNGSVAHAMPLVRVHASRGARGRRRPDALIGAGQATERYNKPFPAALRDELVVMGRIGMAMGISGILLAAGTSLLGLWAPPLVVVPLLLTQFAFRRYRLGAADVSDHGAVDGSEYGDRRVQQSGAERADRRSGGGYRQRSGVDAGPDGGVGVRRFAVGRRPVGVGGSQSWWGFAAADAGGAAAGGGDRGVGHRAVRRTGSRRRDRPALQRSVPARPGQQLRHPGGERDRERRAGLRAAGRRGDRTVAGQGDGVDRSGHRRGVRPGRGRVTQAGGRPRLPASSRTVRASRRTAPVRPTPARFRSVRGRSRPFRRTAADRRRRRSGRRRG